MPSSPATVMTLYHGSPFEFTTFNDSKAGLHFGTKDQAAHAATIKLGRLASNQFARLTEKRGWRGRIYRCEVRVRCAKRIKDPRTPSAWSRHIRRAKAEGYDAIIYSNDFEGFGGDSYCLFESSSILSLTMI